MGAPKIAVCLPYFGEKPSWWSFFLRGALANPGVDFLFFSDCISPEDVRGNVATFPCTLSDIRRLAEVALGSKVVLDAPRKLCDIKPAYGRIFEDYLRGYDYWGFGDIDLVYGDLLSHPALGSLGSADVISLREGWISGALTLLRNSPKVVSLFESIRDWKGAVGASQQLLIDELGGMGYGQRAKGVPFDKLTGCRDSFSAAVARAEAAGQIKVRWTHGILESLRWGQVLVWSRGTLSEASTGKPWAAYHMVIDKRRFFRCASQQRPGDVFLVTTTGFYAKDEPKTVSYYGRVLARVVRGAVGMGVRRLKRLIALLGPSGWED